MGTKGGVCNLENALTSTNVSSSSQVVRGKYTCICSFSSLFIPPSPPPPKKRFHVAMTLVSNGSQRKSKRGENISDTLACGSCATSLFSPQLDVICDLIKNRRTATWNLFVTKENNVKINNLMTNEGNQNYYYVYFHNEFCVIHS